MSDADAASLDEPALVEAVRAGSEEAWERFVRTYVGPMRAVARKYLKEESEADDVVQEAFLSAFREIGRFESRSSIATWLHRITANAALMRLRSRAARPVVHVEDLLPQFSPQGVWPEFLEPWVDVGEDPLVREELCSAVRDHIARLSPEHRIPLLMRSIEGVGNDEIARRLGISVNAAKIRVHRARQALRTLMSPLMASNAL